jgi:hypothetical protein
LVFSPGLASLCLKSRSLKSAAFVDHWVSMALPADIPQIKRLFSTTPLLLDDAAHRSARQSMVLPYRELERQMDLWRDPFTKEYFESNQTVLISNPVNFVRDYVANVFLRLISPGARPSRDDVNIISRLSSSLFKLLPTQRQVLDYEKSLRHLDDLLARLNPSEFPNSDWNAAIRSVMVMGQEPLVGAFVYRIMHPIETRELDASQLLARVSPVHLVARQVREDVSVENLTLTQGQTVYIALVLANQQITDKEFLSRELEKLNTFEFGAGFHLCLGRQIALKITESFLKQLSGQQYQPPAENAVQFVRDVALLVR